MGRIALRLERKTSWTILDYYTLGKLVHYTADAFTYAHNEWFSTLLSDHREYEEKLQIYFLNYLHQNPTVHLRRINSVTQAISQYHREYRSLPCGLYTDSYFALTACSNVLAFLF